MVRLPWDQTHLYDCAQSSAQKSGNKTDIFGFNLKNKKAQKMLSSP